MIALKVFMCHSYYRFGVHLKIHRNLTTMKQWIRYVCVVDIITGVHGEILRNQTTMIQLDTELVFVCHPHIFCIYFVCVFV